MRRLLTLLILTVVHPTASCAGQKPPDAVHFSILGVKIGEDSLESIENKLGKVTKCRINGHISIAGYTSSKEELIFEFSEVGGGDITGFYIHASSVPSHDGCTLSRIPEGVSNFNTGGGIHLGMTAKEFVAAFGSPENSSKESDWKYHWAWKAKLTDEERQAGSRTTPASTPPETADISVWIEARFVRGILSYFHISKLETL